MDWNWKTKQALRQVLHHDFSHSTSWCSVSFICKYAICEYNGNCILFRVVCRFLLGVLYTQSPSCGCNSHYCELLAWHAKCNYTRYRWIGSDLFVDTVFMSSIYFAGVSNQSRSCLSMGAMSVFLVDILVFGVFFGYFIIQWWLHGRNHDFHLVCGLYK